MSFPGFCGPHGVAVGGEETRIGSGDLTCIHGALSIDRAYFFALWLESLMYGWFIALYGLCLWVLIFKHKKLTGRTPYCMLLAATTMFLIASAHLSIDIYRAFQATFVSPLRGLYYLAFADMGFLCKTGLYFVQTLISDAFLVYRCFVIWERCWAIIILPVLLVLAQAANGVVLIVRMSHASGLEQTMSGERFIGFFTGYLALTVAANGLATVLIVIKIWTIKLNLRVAHTLISGIDIWAVVIIIMESGAIYSMTLIALLVTYLLQTNGQFIVLDAVTPLIGIVFTNIIIRVGLGVSTGGVAADSNTKAENGLSACILTSDSQMSGIYYPEMDERRDLESRGISRRQVYETGEAQVDRSHSTLNEIILEHDNHVGTRPSNVTLYVKEHERTAGKDLDQSDWDDSEHWVRIGAAV